MVKQITKDEKIEKELKTYILYDPKTMIPVISENDGQVKFTGKIPIQAANKAARRGYTDIRLRPTGTNKIRRYKGSIETKEIKNSKVDWILAQSTENKDGDMIWSAKVGKAKYVSVEVIEGIQKA